MNDAAKQALEEFVRDAAPVTTTVYLMCCTSRRAQVQLSYSVGEN